MLKVDKSGVAQGMWHYRPLQKEDINDGRINPFGDEPAEALKIDLALEKWQSCLLLQPFKNFGNRALLVVSYGVCRESQSPALNCRYVRTMVTHRMLNGTNWS